MILLTLLRLVEGIGEAFTFGPGVILVTGYFKKGSEGLGIGFYSATFDMRRGRRHLGLGGARRRDRVEGEHDYGRCELALGACALLLLLVPRDPSDEAFSVRFSELKAVIMNKWLLILSAGLITKQVILLHRRSRAPHGLTTSKRACGLPQASQEPWEGSRWSCPSSLRLWRGGPSTGAGGRRRQRFIAFCFAAAGGLAIAAVASVFTRPSSQG